jgi:hypothetical protein
MLQLVLKLPAAVNDRAWDLKGELAGLCCGHQRRTKHGRYEDRRICNLGSHEGHKFRGRHSILQVIGMDVPQINRAK